MVKRMYETPCYGCEKRKVGCHSVCPEFKEWSEWNVERRKRIITAETHDARCRSLRFYHYPYNPHKPGMNR